MHVFQLTFFSLYSSVLKLVWGQTVIIQLLSFSKHRKSEMLSFETCSRLWFQQWLENWHLLDLIRSSNNQKFILFLWTMSEWRVCEMVCWCICWPVTTWYQKLCVLIASPGWLLPTCVVRFLHYDTHTYTNRSAGGLSIYYYYAVVCDFHLHLWNQ